MTLDLKTDWTALPFVVWDFETTSVDPKTCGPVSVGVVRFEGGVEVASAYTLVNPGMPIPAEASSIHGIVDADVEQRCSLDLAIAELDLWVLSKGAVPVAYNAAYDRVILHRHITDREIPAFDHAQGWLCPMVIVKDADRFVGGKKRHTLAVTCQRRGVQLDDAHNALADARATGRLLVQLLESGAVKACPLGTLLKHMAKRAAEQERDFQAWLAKQPKREGATP